MSWRTQLLEFLRVPPAPSAPVGDHDVRIFRAAPNFLRYKLVLWALKNASAVIGLIVGLTVLRSAPDWFGDVELGPLIISVAGVMQLVETVAVLGVVVQAVWSLLLLRLDFEQRWYLVSDRSLRIREGIVRMHEKTMTFANVQHVTIRQGPLQRLLGIADLQVRTAGGGGGKDNEEHQQDKHDLHVAYFRGVADAAGISTTIRERLRRYADAGLGDPDDAAEHRAPQPQALSAGPALVAAARTLAEEAHALRKALSDHVPDSRLGSRSLRE